MADAKRVLSEAKYKSYRNVRAVALLYAVFGFLLIAGSILILSGNPDESPRDEIPALFLIGMSIVGLVGGAGAIATRLNNLDWAWLIKVMAYPYLLAFPLGTILGYVVLSEFSNYEKSVKRLRKMESRRRKAGSRRPRTPEV